MSDTPRTDAAAIRCACSTYVVPSEFARELERENAALRADIHAHEQINKQLIEDKRRLDWLTDTGCWLTFPSLSKHPNWKYGTARDVIDLARKEAQP